MWDGQFKRRSLPGLENFASDGSPQVKMNTVNNSHRHPERESDPPREWLWRRPLDRRCVLQFPNSLWTPELQQHHRRNDRANRRDDVSQPRPGKTRDEKLRDAEKRARNQSRRPYFDHPSKTSHRPNHPKRNDHRERQQLPANHRRKLVDVDPRYPAQSNNRRAQSRRMRLAPCSQ